jgi:hypothetical protein
MESICARSAEIPYPGQFALIRDLGKAVFIIGYYWVQATGNESHQEKQKGNK